MREILRSNDPVLINFAQSVLRGAGIVTFLADQHISVVEGSIGAFPRRLMVGHEDWTAAHRELDKAGLGDALISDGDPAA